MSKNHGSARPLPAWQSKHAAKHYPSSTTPAKHPVPGPAPSSPSKRPKPTPQQRMDAAAAAVGGGGYPMEGVPTSWEEHLDARRMDHSRAEAAAERWVPLSSSSSAAPTATAAAASAAAAVVEQRRRMPYTQQGPFTHSPASAATTAPRVSALSQFAEADDKRLGKIICWNGRSSEGLRVFQDVQQAVDFYSAQTAGSNEFDVRVRILAALTVAPHREFGRFWGLPDQVLAQLADATTGEMAYARCVGKRLPSF